MYKFQQGITLLESLIALLVLSIGLLGTAHLMATGIKQSSDSLSRMQATYIAQNLIERMRANPAAVANLEYINFDSDSDINTCIQRPAAYCQAEILSVPNSCTSAQLATFDYYQSVCGAGASSNDDVNGGNGLRDLLAGGRLQVSCNAIPCAENSEYTITVSWDEIVRQGNTNDQIKTKSIRQIIRP